MIKSFEKIDKKIAFFLFLLVVISALIRGYNFQEWLLVRSDQIRDSGIARKVLDDGVGSLRLLGPKITKVELPGEEGGETFNMGPFYYYSQAISMKLYGDPSPWTIAIFDFVSSLLAIPLFYLAISRVFSKRISLLSTIFFSSSFLIIQYSRFSWNPNQLFFWQLFFIYFLLKFESANKKRAGFYLLWSFLGLLVISQLHFLAIIGTTLVFIGFFIYKKGWQKLKLKHYLLAFLLFFIFHIPIFVSDIKNEGENFQRMWYGVRQQSSEDGFFENFKETVEKSSRFYFYFVLPITEEEFDFIIPIRVLYLFISLGFIGLIFLGKIKGDENKKTLSFVVLLYFMAFFFANIGMADRLEKPRYWLSIAPISFFILAFWLDLINKIKKKWFGTVLMLVISIVIIFENGYSVYYWYASLIAGDQIEIPFKDPILRPYRNLITLGELERAVDYMASEARKARKGICYYSADYQTKSSYEYITSYNYPRIPIKALRDNEDSSKDCEMFLILRTGQDIKDIKEDLSNRFEYKKIYKDGALIMWKLKVIAGRDYPARGIEAFNSKTKPDRVELWGEVFNSK